MEEASQFLQVTMSDSDGFYLGLPSKVGNNMEAVFQYIVEKSLKSFKELEWSHVVSCKQGIPPQICDPIDPHVCYECLFTPTKIVRSIGNTYEQVPVVVLHRERGRNTMVRMAEVCKPKKLGGLGLDENEILTRRC
ncbi:hypothetical protein Syun_013993 [Stephania yunnanensis]|uniref:Uncharacterized protein n=1 Tax=Stephania yunnanensis TaxID=152371 RepID=A0AAP0P871_9MAGN